MKLSIDRNRITLCPERGGIGEKDRRDEAYIEEVLGLRKDGDTCLCRRVNVLNTSGLALIEIVPREKEEG